jgi:peptidoglycan hydrolase-like protein with peptidoglycan-binding domain
MKQYLSFIVLAFLLSVGVASASEGVGANGPISGQNIAFPINGTIPAAQVYTQGTSTNGMGGIGNAESCTALTYSMYGSRGASVAELQTLLNTYTNAQLPVTGFYGPRTVAAVKVFQRSQGIAQTGRQYRLTTDALNRIACGQAKTFSTTLKRGYRGPAVVALQQFLNTKGNAGYPVPVTGYFGPRTEAAVKAFQVAQGIPATGKVWTRTLAAMNSVSLGTSVARVSAPITSTVQAKAPMAPAAPVMNAEAPEAPSVTVTDDSKQQTAAVAQSTGFFNAQTLPWILLALAAGFGYIYGPWRKKEEVVPTTSIKM